MVLVADKMSVIFGLKYCVKFTLAHVCKVADGKIQFDGKTG